MFSKQERTRAKTRLARLAGSQTKTARMLLYQRVCRSSRAQHGLIDDFDHRWRIEVEKARSRVSAFCRLRRSRQFKSDVIDLPPVKPIQFL